MDPTLLLLFSTSLLGTFYLFYASAKRLLDGRFERGAILGATSVATGTLCLFLGVLAIQPAPAEGLLSTRVARSVFHLEVWPWLVPISSLCILILWLIGHALRAFGAYATRRALTLSLAALLCLIPLGYVMFVLSYFAILTGPPKTENELIDAFERSTGLPFLETAKVRNSRSHRSDSFGDWQGSLTFEVPAPSVDLYRRLPAESWPRDVTWRVWSRSLCCDWVPADFPDFLPPDGALYVVADEEHYKFLALHRATGMVYFLRSSW